MARRGSLTSLVSMMAREAARQERIRQQQLREQIRESERNQQQQLRLGKEAEKEEKQQYIESRLRKVQLINSKIDTFIEELKGILSHTLSYDDTISFDSLRKHEEFRAFVPPVELEKLIMPEEVDYISTVQVPSQLKLLIPGTKKHYEEEIQKAKDRFQAELQVYQQKMEERNQKFRLLKTAYEKEKKEYEEQNKKINLEIDEFEKGYYAGDPSSICAYYAMVLERSEYPEGFPQEFRLAYLPDSKELVIEYELPNSEIVPKIVSAAYQKTKDSIVEKPRSISEIKTIYQDMVSSICLRTIHEIFESDQGHHINVVVFNGFVQSIDPATGHDVRPCIISLRTIRERFDEIALDRIDKPTCLRNLGAQVSPKASELQPVKPVVEFNMVDKRFVEQSDILTDLDNRPNLMELNPFEFENLISNLFRLVGFESKLTRSSRDGGIDVVAYDPRPLLGGKVVIQAKRYKNVVGVSAVRDLYGTMINEGASKGILVTTSHYGPDAYDFAKDKPIELLDGGALLYLLNQHGIEAKIIFPDEFN